MFGILVSDRTGITLFPNSSIVRLTRNEPNLIKNSGYQFNFLDQSMVFKVN